MYKRLYSPWNSTETLRITSNIGTVGDIIEDAWVSVKHGVHETNRALALVNTFLVNLPRAEPLAPDNQQTNSEPQLTKFRTEANNGDAKLEP